MAARKPLHGMHQEEVRRKIQATQLINRLTNHVLKDEEMSPTQVRAAEILLKKAIPDLSATQIAGDPDKPLISRVENVIVDPAKGGS